MLLSTYRLKVLSPVFPAAFSPCSYLLHDISWAALVPHTVTAVVAADGGGVVLLFPHLSVNELLHHRARQGTCEYVDENDRLHEQNLPHFWILPLTRFSRKNKTSQRSLGRKETATQPAGGRTAAPDHPTPRPPQCLLLPIPAGRPCPRRRTSAGPLPAPSRPARGHAAPCLCPHCATPRAGRRGRLSSGAVPPLGREGGGGRRGAAWGGAVVLGVPLRTFPSAAQ